MDIKDFWNRWHITLSTWLRDFVFMRFVRMATKRKLFANRIQTACAGYLVDMLLMGAWHGLTPDYLAYGAYHGLLLAATEVYQKRSAFHKRKLTPDYLAYGAYHGLLLAATEVYQKRSAFHKRNRKRGWYRALSWLVTLQLVIFGFALFSGQVGGLLRAALGMP